MLLVCFLLIVALIPIPFLSLFFDNIQNPSYIMPFDPIPDVRHEPLSLHSSYLFNRQQEGMMVHNKIRKRKLLHIGNPVTPHKKRQYTLIMAVFTKSLIIIFPIHVRAVRDELIVLTVRKPLIHEGLYFIRFSQY